MVFKSLLSRTWGHWLAAAAVAITGCTGQIGVDPTLTGGTSTGTGGTGGPGSTTGGNPTGTTTTGGTGGVVNGKWEPPPCKPENHAFASGRIWQITDEQYVNTVRDVLGITLTGSEAEISGVNTSGEYTNLSDSGGSFTEMLAQNYQVAAQRVATQAIVPAKMNSLLVITGTAAPTAMQVQAFITNKVARLWRRPLAPTEVTNLYNIYAGATMNPADGGPPHGLDLLIQAVLQSPSFLFRTELGPPSMPVAPATTAYKLTAFELASALSFMFTNSAPDDALWAVATNNTLTDSTVLTTQVNRLATSMPAQTMLPKYVSYWLWIERVPAREKDYMLYPEYTPAVMQAVYQSGFAWVKDIVFSGDLSQLFTSNKHFVNSAMSTVYGLPAVSGTTVQQVTATTPERSMGVFSQAAILVATNKRANILDPVHHGLFVLEDLLAGADIGIIPGPPADALSVAATMTGNERELVAKRAVTSPCAGCHSNFDGYGLTRYRFDAIGRYNTTKYVKMDTSVMPPKYVWDTNPAPLDESATIPDLVGADLKGALAGPAALAAQLVGDGVRRRVAYSAGAHLVMFLMGTDSNLPNSCELKDVKEHFYQTGSFKDFFTGVATSPGFINRDPGM